MIYVNYIKKIKTKRLKLRNIVIKLTIIRGRKDKILFKIIFHMNVLGRAKLKPYLN